MILRYLSIFVLLLLCVSQSGRVAGQFQCKDMKNQNVDWFVFYKLPKVKGSPSDAVADGTAFLYLDKNNKQWVYPTMNMLDGNHAIAYTLQQYYDRQDDSMIMSIFYNDEHPDNITSSSLGHQKGVVAFDAISGFWLIHSIPKFPENTSYVYPPNAHSYGQMGICVTLPNKGLNDIANQLFFTQPFIYRFDLPPQFASLYPKLADVKKGNYQKAAPFSSVKPITTAGGTQFVHFAKAKGFKDDIYGGLIAPYLNTDLFAETWQHEPGNMGDWCMGRYEILDITWVNLPFGFNFENWSDHSKYAIAVTEKPNQGPTPPWVCIGDINRQTHQMVRGGGSLCLRDSDLFNTFKSIPTQFNKCNATTPTPILEKMLRSNRVSL